MSLDVKIKFKKSKDENYFLTHPYIYSGLSEADKCIFYLEEYWTANITHNLGEMASHVPVGYGKTLYQVLWRPEEVFEKPNTDTLLGYLKEGIKYMVDHRKELLPYNPSNGWGDYNGLMKFILNYKQACEDNPGCEIEADR